MADSIIEGFNFIGEALQKAYELIFLGTDPVVYDTLARTLYVTGMATLFACLWGIPIAIILGLHSFRGKWVIKGLFTALIGIPTVALGTLLYLLLSNQGPLGSLGWAFTNNAIILGEAILITPIIVTFTSNTLGNADTQLRDLALTLGASRLRTSFALVKETAWSMVLAVSAGFNRGAGELGIAMIVGGNLYKQTRVLTTTIAVENALGEFGFALAYSIILMTIVTSVTLVITLVERWKQLETLKFRNSYKWLIHRQGG
jgi:tungstate transport system permease protein